MEGHSWKKEHDGAEENFLKKVHGDRCEVVEHFWKKLLCAVEESFWN